MVKSRRARRGGANMKNYLQKAKNAAKTLKNTAVAKGMNLAQKAKNKYNQYAMKSMLNEEFENRNNMAGMKPGAASRNLRAVAKMQKNNKTRRNNNRWSSGNKYQAASMATSLFF